MNFHIISIFPHIFDSFVSTSLIHKATKDEKISFNVIDPREFCTDRHRQVDDEIYGWWAWLLIKAEPLIAALKHAVGEITSRRTILVPPDKGDVWTCEDRGFATWESDNSFRIVMPSPSPTLFSQQIAHSYTEDWMTDIIYICGRYEGIDHRVELRCRDTYGDEVFQKLSLGHFVTLWWEAPVMVMIEAIARLVPGVINDELSRQDESYRPEKWWTNLEYPQYTRPQIVEWYEIPEVLLSGHHAKIEEWRNKKTTQSE